MINTSYLQKQIISSFRSLSALPEKGKDLFEDALLPLAVVIGLGMGAVLAYLVANGLWPVALALLFALPAFVLLHRYPFAALLIWLLLAPFVVVSGGGPLRRVYWVIHRALPPAAIAVIILSSWLRIHPRRIPKLSLVEAAIVGYVVVSELSIVYLNPSAEATTILLYDRVIVPVCLYFLVRLTSPDEKDLRRLLPVVAFILVTQSVIGLLSWISPQVLPSFWLDRAGTRTTGSLDDYSVFTSALAFCIVLLFHSARTLDRTKKRSVLYLALVLLGGFMIFFSFSRGSWLAGMAIFLGLFWIYRGTVIRLALVTGLIITVVLGSGMLDDYLTFAAERLYSEQSTESALSRLPVYYAAYRMFEAKPLLGWGYDNFDRYDRGFQQRVGDLYAPDKDHASHNLYLSLIAEQGLVGTFLFLAPVGWWFIITIRVWSRMPPTGFWSRRLVVVLWLVILFHIVVNNFSNMRIVYGLGMWWLTLGLIASIVSRYQGENAPRWQEG